MSEYVYGACRPVTVSSTWYESGLTLKAELAPWSTTHTKPSTSMLTPTGWKHPGSMSAGASTLLVVTSTIATPQPPSPAAASTANHARSSLSTITPRIDRLPVDANCHCPLATSNFAAAPELAIHGLPY